MKEYTFDFPRAHGLERQPVLFREALEDFFVDEQLGFELSGEGEHLWVQVEKTGMNTMDIVRLISEHTGVKSRDIGYAGLKDKQAVTRQWFSIKTNVDTELQNINSQDKINIIKCGRNSRKLRRGSHQGNFFRIRLRDFSDNTIDLSSTAALLHDKGVPNYFGWQRFGINGANINKAVSFFAGDMPKCSHFQRGLYLSAARSFLFNQVLANRVASKNWDQFISGDVMALNKSASFFLAEDDDKEIPIRIGKLDIHPTGPLWGDGECQSRNKINAIETDIAERQQEIAEGLVSAGLKQDRRALRLVPENLGITPAGNKELMVEFSLPRGGYATSVLREFVEASGL